MVWGNTRKPLVTVNQVMGDQVKVQDYQNTRIQESDLAGREGMGKLGETGLSTWKLY